MEESKKSFIEWTKAHKAQLIVTGVGVTALVAGIIVIKNKDAVVELWTKLQNQLKKAPQTLPEVLEETEVTSVTPEVKNPRSYNYKCDSFDVSQHIRNLPDGRHHSIGKEIEAERINRHLEPNQTLVRGYTKRKNAA